MWLKFTEMMVINNDSGEGKILYPKMQRNENFHIKQTFNNKCKKASTLAQNNHLIKILK